MSVRDWEGTAFFGLVKTGRVPRRDFACQACGAGFKVEPCALRLFAGLFIGPEFGLIAALLVLAGLSQLLSDPGFALGFVTFGGLIGVAAAFVTGWGLHPTWIKFTRPIVPDAEVPEVRYRLADPVRRCVCGQPVACHSVTDNRTNGVPTGTEWEYACASCERSFVIESAWGQVFTVFASSVVLALGAGLLSTASGQGAGAWACAGVVALMGVGGWMLALARFVARFRYPVMTQGELEASK